MCKYKLIGENSRYVTYAYKTDCEDMHIDFDKELKCVNLYGARFVFNDESILEPQQWKKDSLEHISKYGNWQSKTLITLSAEDIEFISNKCKEIFGKQVNIDD